MAADAPLLGQGRQLGDGVDRAVGVAGGGADDEDGVVRYGGAGGVHVGAKVGPGMWTGFTPK